MKALVLEVEDTALAILKFKNGGVANIVVSNSQKPGIYGKVHLHGDNGASVGAQTDGGAMFTAGMTSILEPPVNDLWTVPGEEGRVTVEIFTAIYRSQRDGKPIKFPLAPESQTGEN